MAQLKIGTSVCVQHYFALLHRNLVYYINTLIHSREQNLDLEIL